MKKLMIFMLSALALCSCQFSSSQRENPNDPGADGIFMDGLLAVKQDGKWGHVDKKGNVVIPLAYDGASAFYDGVALVQTGKNEMQLINKKNETLLPQAYSYLFRAEKNAIFYKVGEKFGLMDAKGNLLTQAIYDDISPFYDGLAAVEKDDKWGFIGLNGQEVVPFVYDGTYGFWNGYAAVEKDDKWGFIDKTGNVHIDLIYYTVEDFDDYGNAQVQSAEDYKWGLINKNKNMVLENLETIRGEGPLYAARENYESGYKLYKVDGSLFNNEVYKYVSWYAVDYILNVETETEDLFVWFNEDGSIFKSVPYDSGYRGYYRDGKDLKPYLSSYGDGNIDIHFRNSTIHLQGDRLVQAITNKIFIVSRNEKCGIIDNNNNILFDFTHDVVYSNDRTYYICQLDKKYGVIGPKYDVIVPAVYDDYNVSASNVLGSLYY